MGYIHAAARADEGEVDAGDTLIGCPPQAWLRFLAAVGSRGCKPYTLAVMPLQGVRQESSAPGSGR